MCSSHRSGFSCIWAKPIPFSLVGHDSRRESSRNVILVLESVIRGGYLPGIGVRFLVGETFNENQWFSVQVQTYPRQGCNTTDILMKINNIH